MLLSLDIYKEVDLKKLLDLELNLDLHEYLKKHIEKDFDILGEQIGNNEHYIFIQAILYKLPDFLKTQRQEPITAKIRNDFESAFEKILIEPLLKSVAENIIHYKNLLSREEKIDEIKLLLNETVNPAFAETMKNYPLIKLMRINQEIDIKYFESKFYNTNKNKEYPLIDLFLKKSFNLEVLTALPLLTNVTNYLMNKYDHKILRNEAREKKLIDCFDNDDQVREDFEKLKEFWNKYLNIPLQEGCQKFDGVPLNDSSPLSLLLIDNKLEVGSGIQTRLIIQYLAGCQNEFLESTLKNPILMDLFKSFSREPIAIHQANMNHLINIDEYHFDVRLRMYSIINPKYGCGMDVDYDYEKIQLILMNKLIIGKKMLDVKVDRIRTIQYRGELMFNNCMIDSIRRKLIQVPLTGDLVNEVHELIRNCLDNDQKDGIEKVKGIFSSLETFICFLSSNKYYELKDCEITFKGYSTALALQNISRFVKDIEPLAKMCLKNIIQVYEIFESEMFNLNKHLFNDKYKQNLGVDLETEFKEFFKKCDGDNLPTKVEIFNSLKKLAMRCLLADLDETQEIVTYLYERIDLWPKDNFEKKLDKLEKEFPKNIKLMHTLDMLSNLAQDFNSKPIDNHENNSNSNKMKEDIVKREPMGRASNQSNQKKQNLKTLKKAERI